MYWQRPSFVDIPLEDRISGADLQVFRVSGGANVFIDQAVEDGFSADLPRAGVGFDRGVSVAFTVRDALGDAPDLRQVVCAGC